MRGVLVILAVSFGHAICTGPIVSVHQGQLKGKHYVSRSGRNYFAFQGIPYAKPPVGNLRFKVFTINVTAVVHTAFRKSVDGNLTACKKLQINYRRNRVPRFVSFFFLPPSTAFRRVPRVDFSTIRSKQI